MAMVPIEQPEASVTAPPQWAGRRRSLSRVVPARAIWLWLAIVLIGLFFAIENAGFGSSSNLLSLLRSGSSLGIVALGLLLVIVAAEIDLSVGAVYVLAPVVVSVLWVQHRVPFLIALVLGLLISSCVGLFNGLVTVTMRIPSFIVTLGSLNLVLGLTVVLSGGSIFTPSFTTPAPPHGQLLQFLNLGGAKLGPLPIQIVWIAAIAFVMYFLVHRSIFGFRLMALGGNDAAARFARIPVRRYKLLVFVCASLLAGLAGIIDFSFLQSSQPIDAANSLTFPVFAAVIIGGASLSGGVGSVVGTLTGAILLTEVSSGLALLGISAGPQLIFTGAITIGAVALDQGGRLLPRLRRLYGRGVNPLARTSSKRDSIPQSNQPGPGRA
jgi:ribose/xylose/arabinose/galactoside ABC-type transport system permease subunit